MAARSPRIQTFAHIPTTSYLQIIGDGSVSRETIVLNDVQQIHSLVLDATLGENVRRLRRWRDEYDVPNTLTPTVGVRMWCETNSGDAYNLIDLVTAAGAGILNVHRAASGLIQVRRGTTVLDSTTTTFAGAKVYIELQALIDATVGWARLRINGIQEIHVTGENTEGTSGGVERVWVANNSVTGHGGINYTHLYYDHTLAEGEWRGPGRPILPEPVAATLEEFTPSSGSDNEAMIDDATSDGDATHNESDTVGQKDRFTHAGGVLSGIRYQGVITVASKPNSGDDTIVHITRPTDTDFESPEYTPGDLVYETQISCSAVDPETAAAWTPERFNAMEYGYQNGAS